MKVKEELNLHREQRLQQILCSSQSAFPNLAFYLSHSSTHASRRHEQPRRLEVWTVIPLGVKPVAHRQLLVPTRMCRKVCDVHIIDKRVILLTFVGSTTNVRPTLAQYPL